MLDNATGALTVSLGDSDLESIGVMKMKMKLAKSFDDAGDPDAHAAASATQDDLDRMTQADVLVGAPRARKDKAGHSETARKTVPHRPALCLICGELVCFGSECCSSVGLPGRFPGGADRDKVFECFSHAHQYHGGTGIYVVLKSSMVFVIRNMHCCYWGSPYLDAYGEEDQDLRRGRPLHLNAERYEQLQVLHSTHGFDHDSRVASAWHPGAHRY